MALEEGRREPLCDGVVVTLGEPLIAVLRRLLVSDVVFGWRRERGSRDGGADGTYMHQEHLGSSLHSFGLR